MYICVCPFFFCNTDGVGELQNVVQFNFPKVKTFIFARAHSPKHSTNTAAPSISPVTVFLLSYKAKRRSTPMESIVSVFVCVCVCVCVCLYECVYLHVLFSLALIPNALLCLTLLYIAMSLCVSFGFNCVENEGL